MKILGKIIIITFIIGGVVFARTGKTNTRVSEKNIEVKSEHYWAKDHSDSDNKQLDRKRSHKRRRKIRKPNKGLR